MQLPRLLIVFGIFFSSHYYIWARLVRDMQLPMPWFALATVVIVSLCLGAPTSMLLMRRRRRPLMRALMAINYTWMGLFFMALTLLAAVDALHLLFWVAQKVGMVEDVPLTLEARRQVGLMAAVAIMGAGALSLFTALRGPGVKNVAVRLRRWPKALDGLKIVQISDLHVAPLLGADYVQKVVDRTNALQPDVIAVTGDMVDGTVPQLQNSAAPLAQLRARLGIFYAPATMNSTGMPRRGLHMSKNWACSRCAPNAAPWGRPPTRSTSPASTTSPADTKTTSPAPCRAATPSAR